MQKNVEDRLDIERRTRSQNKNLEWHSLQCFYVTASNIGIIVLMADKRDKEALADQLVNPKILRKHAVLWGQSKEKVAVKQFEEISGIKIKPCGDSAFQIVISLLRPVRMGLSVILLY